MRVLSGVRPLWAAVLVLVVFASTIVTAGPAQAGPGDPPYLSVTKTVSNPTPEPGEPFTYSVRVTCSEASCLDAVLDDALPAELAGYDIESVTYTPSAGTIPRTVTWTVDGGAPGASAPAVATADTNLHVDFTGATTAPVGVGLQNGRTFTVLMTLRVPANLAVGTYEITNTATTSATNSSDSSSAAVITVDVPARVGVDVTKAWTPATQAFEVGRASTIALTATNTSNIPVASLVVQDPQAAVTGDTLLDASNPFLLMGFSGFSNFAMPSGADTVQVDAFVFQGGAWGWVTGTPQATPALPGGVAANDVGGLRFSFAGPAIVPAALATVNLDVAQRATHRNTNADLSTATQSLTNVVVATAVATGFDPVSDTASAPHTSNPATVSAETRKDITPNRIAAGSPAHAQIVATNASDVGVAELKVTDLNYFTANITFGGFTASPASPTWPTGADSAVVIYHPLTPGADEVVAFTNGSVPAPPSQPISGFDIVFSSAPGTGNIAAGKSSTIDFEILTTEAAVGAATSLATTNTATTTVTALNGLTASDADPAGLVLLKPAIDITLVKTVRPGGTANPGERVVTALEATLTTTSDYITADHIVIEDSWTGNGTFWDAFDLVSVAPTQVPANASLAIEVQGPGPGFAWVTVETFAPEVLPFLAEMTQAEIVSGLSTAGASFALSDATGIRFTFDKASGFASSTIVRPYVVSKARSTLRSGGLTAPVPDVPVQYENLAVATGTGETDIGTPLTDSDTGVGPASIESDSGIGPDGIGIDKAWNLPTIPAQSGLQRSTSLQWSATQEYAEIAISDPATNPANPEDTVFEAFDLRSIGSIAASSVPFSNGWYMKYDTVHSIELYTGGAWTTVPAPGTGWVNAAGTFVGYTLTTPQTASATGVRITLRENSDARAAARVAGANFDPYAPEVGSGVVTSSGDREFGLTWRLRNVMRVSGDWATDTATYNTATAGVESNTVGMVATEVIGGASVPPVTGEDSITLTGSTPGVTIDKTVSPATLIYVPMAGTPAASYPTARFTVTARNDSVARASYVRVMDSPVCTDGDPVADCQGLATAAGAVADPFTPGVQWLTVAGQGNPFDRFDLRDVTISASIAAQVDLTASVVWLLHYNDVTDTYFTDSHFASDVNAMSATTLADVVGISVTFQGTNPSADGGSITSANVLTVTLDTRLRTNLRVSGDAQTVAANDRLDVPNRAFAQAYDPVLSDGVATGALDDVLARMTGGDINVAAVKTITPAALTEPTRDDTVTVVLGANPGSAPVSSLAPKEVRLTDDTINSPGFWNQFSFTGLGTLTAPAGSDQVLVSVYGPFGTLGAMEWVSNPAATPIALAAVPVTLGEYPDIQGIRLAFSRADGDFFSASVPAATWTTSSTFTVVLRDTYRDSGDPVELAGTIDNMVEVISDRLNGEVSAVRTAADQIALSDGTFAIAVNKLANEGNHTASAGESVPWDLTFTNTGTGFLTIAELRDTLPASLVYLGTTSPVYTPDPTGTLPAPDTMTQVGNELVFTWPASDRTMEPGETFKVRVLLELQPGLGAGDRATNEMTVTTVETLATCANTVGGGITTGAFADDPTTCGTTDYVTPSAGPNLFTIKGVRGSIAGAENPSNPSLTCQDSLVATGGSYYRAPCAANSVIGGTDAWVLRAQNAGTTGVDEFVLFDALPSSGDRYLISGVGRDSAYRPQMLDDLAVAAPTGTDILIEVTLSLDPCSGTWAGLEGQTSCAQNGEVWTTSGPGTDWSSVTGIRVSLDFAGTDEGFLAPGQFVDVTFSTMNVPASASNPSGASVSVPVVDSYAWNQFGVKYLDTGATAFRKISPARVGVHLLSGELQIDKVIAGTYADKAPSTFEVGVACTVDGVPLDMGGYASLRLSRAEGFTQTIEGLPSGSTCVMTETNSGKADLVTFAGVGVDRVSSVSATVAVSELGSLVTLTNTFDTLAFTGAGGFMPMLLVAIALVMLGAFLALRSRRRLS